MHALEDQLGAVRGFGCAAGIEFELNGYPLMLPPPANHSDAYAEGELEFIIDVWNGEIDGAITMDFLPNSSH
jgi:hypothetical protein